MIRAVSPQRAPRPSTPAPQKARRRVLGQHSYQLGPEKRTDLGTGHAKGLATGCFCKFICFLLGVLDNPAQSTAAKQAHATFRSEGQRPATLGSTVHFGRAQGFHWLPRSTLGQFIPTGLT